VSRGHKEIFHPDLNDAIKDDGIPNNLMGITG